MKVEIKIPLREDIKDPQSEVIQDVLNRYLGKQIIKKVDVSKTISYNMPDPDDKDKFYDKLEVIEELEIFEKIKDTCVREGIASPNVNDIKISLTIQDLKYEKTFLGQYNFKKSFSIKGL